ncbi:DUF1861 domain-containing protein [Cohnella lubricantis]|uniref:DUF1861 family protein n=1 Tax=Cohnella lubricantis TaxID=2163172 RepID=A0A841TFW1_9BACL|nr:DUF1861 family protein [Cohnella lubricantis]MBB6678829.1 DUF1861 family protein [Cohnella lubricantis]MBP2117325.1 hypothetical protein [Cohnella lubricantis]
MQVSAGQAISCAVLFDRFQRERPPYRGDKLVFSGMGNRDVYNITAPFQDEGEKVIAGRVEDRSSERSEVMFFVEREGEWVVRDGAPVFELQDPFVATIRGELVFGGVEVYFDGDDPHYVTSWRTVFYRGKSIRELEPFAKGPLTMKDIRLIDLRNGRIGVFTRPMPVGDARAMIGYMEISELEELTEEAMANAELLYGQFLKVEWGGANEAHLLKGGRIGVLGHIARMDDGNIRHYYPMTFAYDPANGAHTPIKLIAARDMFPDGPAKRPDLVDVLFSGGLVRHGDGKATLYTGVSDAEAHRIVIDDPFAEYESE